MARLPSTIGQLWSPLAPPPPTPSVIPTPSAVGQLSNEARVNFLFAMSCSFLWLKLFSYISSIWWLPRFGFISAPKLHFLRFLHLFSRVCFEAALIIKHLHGKLHHAC